MTKLVFLLLLWSFSSFLSAQTLSPVRSVDWTLAGLKDSFPSSSAITIHMQNFGLDTTGRMPNDTALMNAILSIGNQAAIIQFPSGHFLFDSTIVLPNNTILKGQGADSTILLMKLDSVGGHAIVAKGRVSSDTSHLHINAYKNSNQLIVWNSQALRQGDWIRLRQYDLDWTTSSWGQGHTGQIVQVDSVRMDTVWLASPLRMDYDTARQAYFVKLNPAHHIGIECLKIKRLDDPAPFQASNIHFEYAVNCWVSSIESENCTFSHIKGMYSSNLLVKNSYFHHGFNYGSGGRAYGVVLQYTTNECLVEDNIFEHLRHAMLLQMGANGNVFAYNYSLDPFWAQNPSDGAGDIVLHGNYVYANLFEQNICRNIIIDNSHGANGPHNTFFRNRAEGYGVFFTTNNTPNQNIIGNEITNTTSPYSIFNYRILGTGHFLYGNNDKGTIHPIGTDSLADISYAYAQRPDFIPLSQWSKIGPPQLLGAASIPAKDRYTSSSLWGNSCYPIYLRIPKVKNTAEVKIYPNPVHSIMTISSLNRIKSILVSNELGQTIYGSSENSNFIYINTQNWPKGMYFVLITFYTNQHTTQKIIKNE